MRLLLALILSCSLFSAQAAEPVPKPVIKKAKLLRSNPYRFASIRIAGNSPWTVIDDEDMIPQRRYRFKLESDDNELSDYVKTRLLIARTRALKKYLEVHSNTV